MAKRHEKDGLGDRMERYEIVWRRQYVPRPPLIVRVDGKAFHTLTRDLNRPFATISLEARRVHRARR